MAKPGRRTLEMKHPEIIPLLGVIPDAELATRFGCSSATIKNARKRQGVPYAGHAFSRGSLPSGLVVLVFRYHPPVEDSTLAATYDVLDSRNGIRVYHRDALDPRITMGKETPFFDNWPECASYLQVEPHAFRPCLLDYKVARLVFGRQGFTEPLIPAPSLNEKAFSKIQEALTGNKSVTLTPEEIRALL